MIYFYSRLGDVEMPNRVTIDFSELLFMAKTSRYSIIIGDNVLLIVDDFIF